MKIILATESYYPNIDGGAIAQHRLVLELIKRGHHLIVFAPNKYFKNYQEDDHSSIIYRPRGVVLPLYMNNTYYFSPLPIWFLKNIIKRNRPNVVNLCSPYPISISSLLWARKFHIPVVGSIHMLPENMLSPFLGRTYYDTMKNLSWKYLVNFYNRVDQATIPTETGAMMYKNHGLKTKITPISNGVDTKVFTPKNNGEYLRDHYDIPKDNIILYTGRICAEKNLDILIKAIPYVTKTIDAHFLLCGSGGSYKKRMQKLAEHLGVINHTTFIDFLDWKDYPNIYNVADLFVMPAESELQSIVTMEAIASGLPAVVVDNGAVPELVSKDNGLLYKPGDSVELAEHIITILSNSTMKKEMSRNSITLSKQHSLEYIAEQFEQVYLDTIGQYKHSN
jgi:glycosyltransferase involved in cell wall biosynthesis